MLPIGISLARISILWYAYCIVLLLRISSASFRSGKGETRVKKYVIGVVLVLSVSIIFQGFVIAGMLGGRSKQAMTIQPTGAAIWDLLKQMDYSKKWRMWPGKTSLYPGKEPHGALLTTYVNIPVFMAIAGKRGMLPNGSMIVTQNYSAERNLTDITVMYKAAAYNPEAGDWFWVKYAPDGKVQAEGKVDTCIKCHAAKKDNDYIMTTPLK